VNFKLPVPACSIVPTARRVIEVNDAVGRFAGACVLQGIGATAAQVNGRARAERAGCRTGVAEARHAQDAAVNVHITREGILASKDYCACRVAASVDFESKTRRPGDFGVDRERRSSQGAVVATVYGARAISGAKGNRAAAGGIDRGAGA